MVFCFPVTVYYENTDAQGVVYHAEYLKFMERARTEFLKASGIKQKELKEKEDILFVVREMTLRYLSPAVLDDILDVTVTIDPCESAPLKLIMGQEIKRGDEVLVSAQVMILCLKQRKVIKIPQNIWDHMQDVIHQDVT